MVRGIEKHEILEQLKLRRKFNRIRENKEELRELIKDFCHTYLRDDLYRPLILSPMQEAMVLRILYLEKDREQVKVVVLAPRGSGKSYAIAAAVTIWLYFYRSNEEVLLIAPHENQSVDRLFDPLCRFFITSPKLQWMVEKVHGGRIRTGSKPKITIAGGSWARPFAVNRQNKGESVRGQHGSLVIVDESPYIPVDIFQPNVEPTTRRKKAPFINIGTPFTEDNHTYKYMYHPAYLAEFCEPLKFTYLDGLPARKGDAYESAYTDTGMHHIINQWGKESMKFQTEYMCEFIAAEGSYFPFGISHNLENYFLPARTKDTYIATVADLGRKDASTVIGIWVKSYRDDGISYIKLIDIHEIIPKKFGQEFPLQRRKIKEMLLNSKSTTLILDAKGLGIGMVDEMRADLRASGRAIRLVEVKFGLNKGQYFSFTKDIMQQNRIIIPDPDYLRKKRPYFAIKIEKMMRQFRLIQYTLADDGVTIKIKKPLGEHDDFVAMTVMAVGEMLRREEAEAVVEMSQREHVFISKTKPIMDRRKHKIPRGRILRKGAGFIG